MIVCGSYMFEFSVSKEIKKNNKKKTLKIGEFQHIF